MTLIRAPNLETDLAEGHVSLDQQLFCLIHPAPNHILVGSQPGSVFEQARKMGRARLPHSGKRNQR